MITLNKKEYRELIIDLIKSTSTVLFVVTLSSSNEKQKIEKIILTIFSIIFYHLFISKLIKKLRLIN